MDETWRMKHEWWEEDFRFELGQMEEIAIMIKKHPDLDDPMGKDLREMYKTVEKNVAKMQREYKKVYGRNFNLRPLKKELWGE